MNLKVNGEIKVISPEKKKPLSILDFIKQLKYNPHLIVVEYNGIIISRGKWEQVLLKDNDSLEIVTIVGGGS